MAKLRLGAVSYLNTKPLIEDLPRLTDDIDLILDVPSKLAEDLAAGRLDVALIPSIEYFRAGRYSILEGISISSYGPVLSVKVFSRVPFGDIRTLALDAGSRTSIALTKILLNRLFGIQPETQILSMASDPTDIQTDATLLIGDRAMRVPDGQYPFTLDLGYEWSRWTGLPFVFAFWAVGPDVVVPQSVQDAMHEAKRLGRPRIPKIAELEAQRLGIDETRCRYYLEHVIRHHFGEEERQGLCRFYELAVEHGLAPKGVACVFHGSEHSAKGD